MRRCTPDGTYVIFARKRRATELTRYPTTALMLDEICSSCDCHAARSNRNGQDDLSCHAHKAETNGSTALAIVVAVPSGLQSSLSDAKTRVIARARPYRKTCKNVTNASSLSRLNTDAHPSRQQRFRGLTAYPSAIRCDAARDRDAK